jgi:hypothetical protein
LFSLPQAFQLTKQQFRQLAKVNICMNDDPLYSQLNSFQGLDFEGDSDTIFIQANDPHEHLGVLHRLAFRSKLSLDQILSFKDDCIAKLKDSVTSAVMIESHEGEGSSLGTPYGTPPLKGQNPALDERRNSVPDSVRLDKDPKVMVWNEFVHALTIMADVSAPNMPVLDRLEKFFQNVENAGEVSRT